MSVKTRVISSLDIAACPRRSMAAEHFLDFDEGCACREERGLAERVRRADKRAREAKAKAAALKLQYERWFGDDAGWQK